MAIRALLASAWIENGDDRAPRERKEAVGLYSYVQGRVAEKGAGVLVIDCGGVGYQLAVTPQTLAACGQVGDVFRAHTRLIVKEDAWELYGFATKEERDMFSRLTQVTGIGPKTAIALLSVMAVGELSLAIVTGDAKSIARAPGIGPKTAQRLVLELKDRVTQEDLVGAGSAGSVTMLGETPAIQDAIAALIALGYNASEAATAVAAVKEQAGEVDQLVVLALRRMAR